MKSLSPMQLLRLWSELEDARSGTHGYGGDTAEIYLYTVLPDSPSLEFCRRNGFHGPVMEEDALGLLKEAKRSLIEVFRLFESMRECRVVVCEGTREPWVHRIHVRVTRRAKKARKAKLAGGGR